MKKTIVGGGQPVAANWPPAHLQGPNDTKPDRATPMPGIPDDGNSSQPLTEPGEEYSSPVSELPPPTIEAFPEDDPQQKPPQEDTDSPSIPWPTIVAIAAVSIAVIVVVVAVTVVLTHRGGRNPSPTAAPSTTTAVPLTTTPLAVTPTQALPSTVTVTPPTVTVTPPLPAPPAPVVPQNCGSTSLQQLQAQANIDRPDVTTWVENHWVPQLSSKRPGTVDDGKVWDYSSICREHAQLRQQYGARLLWSGDWPRAFKEHDYWVTIAWFTFPDRADAQAWCDNHGRDSDHCYPTLIQ
jgi:serine/threonine-protein kinase